ncbi:hypothetical protein P8C59_005329 [Phyllachora maydis]|uniref:Integrase catalytic domain-containing protein n=1 Tax=Phyllachora maydis TaxID=1825666 RepID=A0AAD9I5W2_9PEZI|nr:hypothetical protein P8C59_005329 [Phyllachora maydis]
MADQAKGKEDKEDSEDYSELIEVLKQHIKSNKRLIQGNLLGLHYLYEPYQKIRKMAKTIASNIKTLLLSLNTLKASIEDSISAIKNISSTLASLTNSSNAAATGKTSYSPRFDPFSGTMDLDSPPRPPRKEPHLGPAVDNTATSNLDPPIDTGSKEGFKDTITSSIVKELSKKAYTIPDDSKLSRQSNFKQWIQALSIVLRALGISNFLENPDISNTYSDSDQAILLMLLRDSLSSSPRAAISRPIESKKKDVYNEFHALTFSTYKKGLSAFNAEFNGYLAKLTIAKIDIDPSLILNQNPAIEAYRAAYIANSSNSTPNSNSNPSKKGKNKKKGKKKASYNVERQNYSAKSAEQASFMLGSYNLAIEEEEESDSSSNSRYKKRKDFKGKGLKTSSNNKAKYKDNKPRRRPRDPALYNSWLYNIGSTDHISNSKERPAGIGSIILEVLSRKAPPTYTKLVLDNVLYLPNIDINIVSGVRHYNSGGCLIKETLYRGNRRCIAILDFKKSGFFLNVKGSSKPILHTNFAFPLGLSSYTTKSIEPQRNKIVVEIPSNSIRKEDYRPIIEDAIVSEAIEPNKRYKLRNSPAKGTTLEGVGPSLRGKRPRRPLQRGGRTGPIVMCPSPNRTDPSNPNPADPNPNPTALSPLGAINKAPKRLGYSFLTYLTTVTTVTATTTTTTSAANPAITITATRSSDISFDSPFKGLSSSHIGLRLLKKTSSITKGLPNFDKIKEADFHCSSCDRGKAVRRVSKALIPDPPRVLDSIEGDTVKIRPRPYNRNPIVLLLVDRKSRYRWVFNLLNKLGPIVANAIKGFFRGLRNGFGRYPTKFHFDGGTEITDLLTTWLAKRGIKFSTSAPYIHEQNGLVERSVRVILDRPTDNTALEGELVDLDLDLEGAVSPDPSNLNTEKPISIEIGPSKLEPYESSSDSELDEPLLDKPINPVIVESTRPTISIRKPELPEPITNEPLDNSNLISEGDKMQLDYYKLLAKTSSYILSFVYKARKRVISKDSTPTTYKQVLKLPRDERSKWLEAITKEFIQLLKLGVFKFLPRSLLPSNCKLITCRNVLKVKKDAKNRPIKYKSRLVARGFIQVEGLDYTVTYASTRAFLNSALREEIYIEIPEGLLDLAASNKAIYKLLLKYGYNPSTPNIIKLSKALYGLKQSPREWQDKLKILLKSLGYLPLISDPGVFYNAKTWHFIVTYVDDCLFIGPNIGYITDLKKRLNKVYAIEDLGPAAYFLGLSRSLNRPTKSHLNAAKNLFKYLNSTKDYSICFSYNGNTVADLGPKLSNSSNITTKLSRDFHSKEGPRPLTTTSTTIVDSRNSKGSSRTSIINSSLVPIGFSDSDFAGDKATSKSTYGYLYKLAGRPISWKTKRATTIALSTLEAETDGLTEAIHEYTLLKFRYVREQVKAKIVTIIYLNTKCIPADGLTKALLVTATTGKTSYSPRFDPFSGTIDLDSPLHPPRKEPHLGPAIDNTATSNLDPPIDTGSKEGFKDTITRSIAKELSKEAYTIPDDTVLLMLLYNSLSSSPRSAISRPIESKKEDVYNEVHALTFSTYKKGLSAFNVEFNGYLAKLTMAKIDIDPSLILNYQKGKNKKKGKKKASYNIKGQNYSAKSAEQASFMLGSYNLAIEEEEESDSSSDSSSSSDSNTQLAQLLALKGYKKRKDLKGKGLKTSSNNKAKYKDNQPRRRPRDPALYNSWLYDTGSTEYISNSKERIGSIILEVLSRKAPPTYTKLVLNNVLYLPNININIISGVRYYNSGGCLIKETLYRGDRRCIAILDFKKSGFFLNIKGSSKPILHANSAFPLGLTSYNTTKSIEPQRNKIVVETPSNSIRKEDYRPIIEDAIVSEAIEPKKRYKLRNSPAKGTTLEGIGPSLRGKRPYRPVEPFATASAPYQSPCKTREPKPLTGTRDLPYVLREPVIEGNKVEKAISSPTLKEPNIGQRDYYNLLNLAKLYRWVFNLPDKSGPIVADAIKGFFGGLRNGFGRYPTKFHSNGGTEITDLLTTWLAKRGIKFSTSAPYIHEQNSLVERSVRVILDLELVNSTAITNKETTPFQALFDELEPGIPYIPNLERYRAIGARGEAIIPLEKRSKSLKFTSRTEECKLLAVLGSKTYLVYISSRRAVLKTSTFKFIEENIVLGQPTNNTALEGELVDLDLDLEGAVSPDPSNLNTEKPISIEIGPSKLELYESSSNKYTRPTISIRKPKLLEALLQTIEPIFIPKPIEVIAPNQPKTNEPLDNSDLISEGDKMQLDYYKLLAKTSSYILSFIYKARKRVISKDSTPITYKQVLKLPRDERSKWLEAITKKFIQLLELGVFKFLPRSLLPSYYKLITCQNVLKVKKDAKNRPIRYKSRLLIGPDIGYITDLKKRLNKVYAIGDLGPAAYFLGLSRSLNRPTKSHLNAAKNLLKYLNSTEDYSICFSYNGNTVADLRPKLSNSSNTTTKLSRDFHSKEGPRPLTTTSTTKVDSRNGKGSSRTSIINSSLVPIGFSDSDFTGDKATSKSTYGYLYKLAGRPISWKTKRATTIALSTLEAETNRLIEAIREVQWIIGLFSKLHRPIDYPITLYGDNQGSITVANNPALYARTKHTLLKFRYVREQVKAKIVTIIYLNTKCILADGLTKALLVSGF